MGIRIYLLLAVIAFCAATTGADLVARTTIAGEPAAAALRDHLYWAGVQLPGTLFLLSPFAGLAFLCARAERKARSRGVICIFAIATLILLYFYFQGHQGAQYALLEKKWTAAALSIGLLPFFIGVPVLLIATCAALLAKKLDPRTP